LTITFIEPTEAAKNEKEKADTLRDDLIKMLKMQRGLHDMTLAAKPDDRNVFLAVATARAIAVGHGQAGQGTF